MRERLFLIIAVAACGELLRERIECTDAFAVVGTASDGQSGLDHIERLERGPAIVLIDVGARFGLEAARALRARDEGIRLVALGVGETPAQVVAWAEVGAAGLVARDASLDELLGALTGVARGDAPCSPGVAAALLRGVGGLGEGKQREERPVRLTAREREVALLVTDGLTNKEIARRMQIEPGTAKSHVRSVTLKLGVSRRAQVAAALRELVVLPRGTRALATAEGEAWHSP